MVMYVPGSLVRGKTDPEEGISQSGVSRQRGKVVDGPSCSVGGGSRRVSGFAVSRREEGRSKGKADKERPFSQGQGINESGRKVKA